MNILKIEIIKNDKIINSGQMPYNGENKFITALVSLCDELGAEVPVWTAYEERLLKVKGHLKMDMDKGEILSIFSYSA